MLSAARRSLGRVLRGAAGDNIRGCLGVIVTNRGGLDLQCLLLLRLQDFPGPNTLKLAFLRAAEHTLSPDRYPQATSLRFGSRLRKTAGHRYAQFLGALYPVSCPIWREQRWELRLLS